MSVDFVHNGQTINSISSGAIQTFLSLTRLVQSELRGMPCGLSPIVSDEIWIDPACFVKFVDEFFGQAESDGKFRYFTRWAAEVAGMYENITGTTPARKMLGVPDFEPIRYIMKLSNESAKR